MLHIQIVIYQNLKCYICSHCLNVKSVRENSFYAIHLSVFKTIFQIKNPTYIFITLGGCTEAMIIFGVSAFSFKYLVEMYSLPFDQAGNYLGAYSKNTGLIEKKQQQKTHTHKTKTKQTHTHNKNLTS